MTRTRRRAVRFSAIFFLLCIVSCAATGQTQVEAKLSAAAQQALDKGVLAAKQDHDFIRAMEQFQEARRLAPGASIVYLNLGLAESKIPRRELRSVAWFAAYLAAEPDATSSSAIKEE